MAPRVTQAAAVLAMSASLAACGGDDESTTTISLSKCPPGSGDKVSAGWWSGSVSGISCVEAGRFIQDHALPDFDASGRPHTARDIERGVTGAFESEDFDCGFGPLDDRSGWHATCREGDQVIAFSITP